MCLLLTMIKHLLHVVCTYNAPSRIKRWKSSLWKYSIFFQWTMYIIVDLKLRGSKHWLLCWIAIRDLLSHKSSYLANYGFWQYYLCNVHILLWASVICFCTSSLLTALFARCNFSPNTFRGKFCSRLNLIWLTAMISIKVAFDNSAGKNTDKSSFFIDALYDVGSIKSFNSLSVYTNCLHNYLFFLKLKRWQVESSVKQEAFKQLITVSFMVRAWARECIMLSIDHWRKMHRAEVNTVANLAK